MLFAKTNYKKIFLLMMLFINSAGISSKARGQNICSHLFLDANFSLIQSPPQRTENLEQLILQTPRFELRPLDTTYLDQVATILMNPKNIEMSGDEYSRELISKMLAASQTKLSDFLNSQSPRIKFGIFKDGEFVGTSGLSISRNKSIFESGVGKPTEKWGWISYSLDPSVWGQGLATELTARLIKFAFETLNFHGIFTEVETYNIASQKVLKKLGFTEFSRPGTGLTLPGTKLYHYYLYKTTYDNLKKNNPP